MANKDPKERAKQIYDLYKLSRDSDEKKQLKMEYDRLRVGISSDDDSNVLTKGKINLVSTSAIEKQSGMAYHDAPPAIPNVGPQELGKLRTHLYGRDSVFSPKNRPIFGLGFLAFSLLVTAILVGWLKPPTVSHAIARLPTIEAVKQFTAQSPKTEAKYGRDLASRSLVLACDNYQAKQEPETLLQHAEFSLSLLPTNSREKNEELATALKSLSDILRKSSVLPRDSYVELLSQVRARESESEEFKVLTETITNLRNQASQKKTGNNPLPEFVDILNEVLRESMIAVRLSDSPDEAKERIKHTIENAKTSINPFGDRNKKALQLAASTGILAEFWIENEELASSHTGKDPSKSPWNTLLIWEDVFVRPTFANLDFTSLMEASQDGGKELLKELEIWTDATKEKAAAFDEEEIGVLGIIPTDSLSIHEIASAAVTYWVRLGQKYNNAGPWNYHSWYWGRYWIQNENIDSETEVYGVTSGLTKIKAYSDSVGLGTM